MTAENCGLESRRRCFFFWWLYDALLLIFHVQMTIMYKWPNLTDRGKESVFTHVGSIYANLFEKKKASQLIFYEEGFRQAKCHVVSQTQGYYLVCIWDSLVKFQGVGLF